MNDTNISIRYASPSDVAAVAGRNTIASFFPREKFAQTILYLASCVSSHLTGTEIVLGRGHWG